MNTPIYNKLKNYRSSDRVPFAMPGHKNGRGLEPDLIDLDVTELSGTLNLRQDTDETVTEVYHFFLSVSSNFHVIYH